MIKTPRFLCSSVLVLVALAQTLSGRAFAATVDELIDQGVELRRQARGQSADVQQEKHSQALKLFQRAHAQEPSPRTLAQMGLAEQSLRRWLDAEAHLASALANDTFPWIIKNRGPLEQALQDVRRHIGQLVIRGTPSGANVYVNGHPRGTLPLPVPIRLPEGEATVQITAPGHQPHNAVVRIPAQGSELIDVRMEPAGSALAATHAPARNLDTSVDQSSVPISEAGPAIPRWAGYTAMVAGAAVVSVGIWRLARDGKCQPPAMDFECVGQGPSRTPGVALTVGGVALGALGAWIAFGGSF